MTAKPIVYNWQDPLLFDEQLSSEERLIRDNTAQFAQSALMPRVLKAYREEHFDPAILREMGDAGLLGATLQGYGCAGVNYVSKILKAIKLHAGRDSDKKLHVTLAQSALPCRAVLSTVSTGKIWSK